MKNILLIAIVTAFALAACGKEDTKSSSKSTTTTTTDEKKK